MIEKIVAREFLFMTFIFILTLLVPVLMVLAGVGFFDREFKIKISDTETIYIKQLQTCLEIAKALGKECED